MRTNTKIWLLIALGFLVMFMLGYWIFRHNTKEKSQFAKEFYEKSLNCKLVKKWVNKSNHSANVICLEDIKTRRREEIHTNTCGLSFDKLWNIVEIGDVISKGKRSLSVCVLKRDGKVINVTVYDVHGYLQDNLNFQRER